MTSIRNLALGTLLGLAAAATFAQTAAPATPRADQRQANQERRIDKGVASGRLTARETQRVEQQQGRIAVAEANAKADGKVTAAERARLHRKQERASANIYKQKHDAQGTRP